MSLLTAFALVGCVHGENGDGERARPSGLVVLEGESDAAVPHVAGREAFDLPGRSTVRLAGAVNAALFGALAPVAVPSPQRATSVAYTSTQGRVPVLRVNDAADRRDRVVEAGALSAAWGTRGLAYVRAPGARLGAPRPFRGEVVVRRQPGAAAQRWSRASAQYVVAAWAGRKLLAYKLKPSWPDLVVFYGPRRERRLASAGALVGVSPDGRRAFIASYDARPAVVRVLQIATGRVETSLTLRSEDALWVIESGSWVGDEVVASASTGLVVFRVRPQAISVEQVLRFKSDAFPVLEPRLEPDGRHVVARVERASRPREALPPAQLLRCDRLALQCASVATGSSADPPRALFNPSRP